VTIGLDNHLSPKLALWIAETFLSNSSILLAAGWGTSRDIPSSHRRAIAALTTVSMVACPSASIRQGYSVLFVAAPALVAALAKGHADGRLEERLAFYAKPKLLIIDELGYLPFEPNAAHLFFQLVSRRYERGSLLITSNRSVGEWGEVFGDPVVATAVLDRLLHHSHVVTIRGDSYRLREKRRAGLMRPPSTASPSHDTDNRPGPGTVVRHALRYARSVGSASLRARRPTDCAIAINPRGSVFHVARGSVLDVAYTHSSSAFPLRQRTYNSNAIMPQSPRRARSKTRRPVT
jgi:hypothetical protein